MNTVAIAEPRLTSETFASFIVYKLTSWVTGATWVWLAIAFLAPQFGITWLMVLVGIFALRVLRPTDNRMLIAALNRSVALRTKNTTASDNALLRARVAA